MHAHFAADRAMRAASAAAAILLALLLAMIQPVASADAATEVGPRCEGTSQTSTLKFTSSTKLRAWGEKVYRNGGAETYPRFTKTVGSTQTHKVVVTYCKKSGGSWNLLSWSAPAEYGSGTVTIKNNKIVDASGPLSLVRKVGTGSFSGVTRNYVEITPFLCQDRITAAYVGTKLAKLVTGLPIPLKNPGSVVLWGVNQSIPNATVPRKCGTTSPSKLKFKPNSKGVAVWTDKSASNSIFTLHRAESWRTVDPVWTGWENETMNWTFTAK